MCIIVKTFSCGVIEHSYSPDCTNPNCKTYVPYGPLPGKCFTCTTSPSKNLLSTNPDEKLAATPTEAYAAVYQADITDAQGNAPGPADLARSLFPDFDTYAQSSKEEKTITTNDAAADLTDIKMDEAPLDAAIGTPIRNTSADDAKAKDITPTTTTTTIDTTNSNKKRTSETQHESRDHSTKKTLKKDKEDTAGAGWKEGDEYEVLPPVMGKHRIVKKSKTKNINN